MKNSKLLKYARKSSIMDVSIKLGKKTFRFNLNEELVIDENIISEELRKHPSYYGYLGMLKVKLERKVKDLELEISRKYAELFLEYKDKSKETNKAEASKLAKYKTEKNPLMIGLRKNLNKAEEDLGVIETCLNSFAERGRMVQSINTNRRNEL